MTSGIANSERAIHTTGRPSCAPGRSQSARGGGAGGGRSAAGSFGRGAGARGPNPSFAVTATPPRTGPASAATANATSSGFTLTDPIVTVVRARPVPIATSAITPPSATGAPIANRISSSDQRTGWATFATTATTV